jgi:hypothetical protein
MVMDTGSRVLVRRVRVSGLARLRRENRSLREDVEVLTALGYLSPAEYELTHRSAARQAAWINSRNLSAKAGQAQTAAAGRDV